MSSAYSEALIKALRKGGWHKGRKVSLEPWGNYAYEMYPLAREILSEFGGLVISKYWSEMERDFVSFDFRPDPVHSKYGEFDEFDYQLKRKIYPVGMAFGDYYDVLVDDSNQVILRVRGEGIIHAEADFTVLLEAIIVNDGLLPKRFLKQEFSNG